LNADRANQADKTDQILKKIRFIRLIRQIRVQKKRTEERDPRSKFREPVQEHYRNPKRNNICV